MDLEINENLEVVSVDNSRLNNMLKYNNTLENGALQILEGLEEFCNLLMEKYADQGLYDKMFAALHQVISSSLDNDSVRHAILTGLIGEKRGKSIKQIKIEKPITKVATIVKKKKDYNKSAVSLFAKTHTVDEIMEHFEFPNKTATKNFLAYNKIKFVHSKPGAKLKVDVDEIRAFAKNMRLSEIARMFGKTQQAMGMYLMRHNIEYKRHKDY